MEYIILIIFIGIIIFLVIKGKKRYESNKSIIDIIEYIPIEIIYNNDLTELLNIINTHRKQLGLNQLVPEEKLTEEAENHCSYMVEHKKASHDNFSDRAGNLQELGFSSIFEVVGYGYSTNSSLFRAYLNSNSHKKALENKNITYVGISKNYQIEGIYNTILMTKK